MARPHDLTLEDSRSTAILKAISNNRRLQIITHLSDGTERSVSEIEALFPDLSQSADWLKSGNSACLLYTSPSPRDLSTSRMPSSA